MAAKQEVITEAAEGVVPVSTQARAPSAGVALHIEKKKLNRGNKFILTVEILPWRETLRFFHL